MFHTIRPRIAAALLAVLMGLGVGVVGAGSASAAYREEGIPVKGNGPGLKNWHCIDRQNGWAGPWRYTKAGAVIDCASYNTRA